MAKVMTAKGSKGPKAKKSKKTTAPATKPETATSSVSTFDNQRDRAAIIRKSAAEEDQFDAKIKVLQDDKKAMLARNIKTGLGMTLKAYRTARALQQMDLGVRADYLSDIREATTALKVGESLNFLDVIEKHDREVIATIEENRAAIQDPYEAGRQVGLVAGSMGDNPFPPKSGPFKKWNDGHHRGLMDHLTGGGSGAAPADEEREAAE